MHVRIFLNSKTCVNAIVKINEVIDFDLTVRRKKKCILRLKDDDRLK